MLNLLVIIAIVGLMLLVFRDEARNQLSNILEAVTPLYTSLARRGRLIRHVL